MLTWFLGGWCFALFLFALFSGCWYSPPFFLCCLPECYYFGCSRGGWPYLMLQCYLFLYLLCISCPMDLQCPIKAVTINQSIIIIIAQRSDATLHPWEVLLAPWNRGLLLPTGIVIWRTWRGAPPDFWHTHHHHQSSSSSSSVIIISHHRDRHLTHLTGGSSWFLTHSSSSSSSSIGVQELLPIPPTVIRPGLGACNRCDRCL